MTRILRQTTEKILETMNKLPDHDAFELEIDNSSGIGTSVTLTVDILYNNLRGKFTTEVEGPQDW
jgi:hypothetical protein